MQLLAVLKPDGTLRRAAGAGILNGLAQSNRCDFLTFRQVRAPIELIESHYGFLKTRSFYPWLEKYMTSGSSYVILLETDENGVSDLRDLLGATQAQKAKPGSLRYKYAPYGGANCLHLSGSNEEAAVEVALWTDNLSLKPGQFDMPIDDYIQRHLDGPNNTVPLRSLCEKIAANGRPASEVDQQHLRELLAPECYDATPEDLDHVAWVIQEACFV